MVVTNEEEKKNNQKNMMVDKMKKWLCILLSDRMISFMDK